MARLLMLTSVPFALVFMFVGLNSYKGQHKKAIAKALIYVMIMAVLVFQVGFILSAPLHTRPTTLFTRLFLVILMDTLPLLRFFFKRKTVVLSTSE